MAVEEVSSGEGDVEMEVPSGSSAARPPEVPKAPQLLSGTGTEGITDAEMMELRIIMDEDWSPPYRSPPAVWSCHGPLEHNTKRDTSTSASCAGSGFLRGTCRATAI